VLFTEYSLVIVGNNAVDCLETLVAQVTCYMLMPLLTTGIEYAAMSLDKFSFMYF